MLEQRDLEAIRVIMKEEIVEAIEGSENRLRGEIAGAIAESEKRMKKFVKKAIVESEKLVLSELDRVQGNLEKRIDAVQKNMDDLNQYYRITRLERDNGADALRLYENLEKRVEVLERKVI